MIKYIYKALREQEINAGNILIPKEQKPFKKDPRLDVNYFPMELDQNKENAILQHQHDSNKFPTSGISTTPHFERALYYGRGMNRR